MKKQIIKNILFIISGALAGLLISYIISFISIR